MPWKSIIFARSVRGPNFDPVRTPDFGPVLNEWPIVEFLFGKRRKFGHLFVRSYFFIGPDSGPKFGLQIGPIIGPVRSTVPNFKIMKKTNVSF